MKTGNAIPLFRNGIIHPQDWVEALLLSAKKSRTLYQTQVNNMKKLCFLLLVSTGGCLFSVTQSPAQQNTNPLDDLFDNRWHGRNRSLP